MLRFFIKTPDNSFLYTELLVVHIYFKQLIWEIVFLLSVQS